jgi:hypothetical protein
MFRNQVRKQRNHAQHWPAKRNKWVRAGQAVTEVRVVPAARPKKEIDSFLFARSQIV